jgi:parallel beta-helix repeat protein
LAIIDSIFRENIAVGDGGGFYNRSSGGVDITVQIVNSSFYENEAVNGGGIYIRSGKTEISQSAIYENTAVQGAGLYTHNTDGVDIENSTISGNTASGNGGGIYNSDSPTNLLFVTVSHNAAGGSGGGLYNTDSSVLFITNSIVANSVSGGDCALGDTTSGFGNGDFNIIEDGSCFSVGVVDPMLGPLQDNGGATFTHALLPNSPAINANGPCQNFISYDQRGVSRPQGGGCDIGAFEFGQFSPNLYLPFIHE